MPSRHTLVVEALDSGFFSNFNCVVNHLHHSLGRNGCCAVRVDWRSKGSGDAAVAHSELAKVRRVCGDLEMHGC
jgi:hypothetical protein